MPEVNYLAVVVAAAAAFILGGLWYSPLLFARPWMAENRFTAEDVKKDFSPARAYGIALAAALVTAYVLDALLIGPPHHGGALSGAKRGAAVGLCLVGSALASTYAFERRSTVLWCINAGYYVLQCTVMGAILGHLS